MRVEIQITGRDPANVRNLKAMSRRTSGAADGGVRAHTAGGEEIPVRTAFWFAWSTFYPHTEVVE